MSEDLDFEAEVSAVDDGDIIKIKCSKHGDVNTEQIETSAVEDLDFEDEVSAVDNEGDVKIKCSKHDDLNMEQIEISAVEDLDFEDEVSAIDNEGDVKIKYSEHDLNKEVTETSAIDIKTVLSNPEVTKPDVDSSNEKKNDSDFSDSGEILDDEEPNDLEEGEIKDNVPTVTNNTDVTCRFFKRGSCLWGSQCRHLHVSDRVYNMFDPILSNKSNVNVLELRGFYNPETFFQNPLLLKPDIETAWEIGLQNAKKIMQKTHVRKVDFKDAELQDIENDWERCLEQAKARVQTTSLKRKDCEGKISYLDLKNPVREKLKDKNSVLKNRVESKSHMTYQQRSPKLSQSKYKKDSSNYGKKSKPDVKESNSQLKWVDPWRRSRSPKGKIRSRSVSHSTSPSPHLLRSRKRSLSSCSSSSSCFKQRIYGSPISTKPSKKKIKSKSASRSISRSPHQKKSISKEQPYAKKNRKRSYSRSLSRSISRSSSRRRCCSASVSRSRSTSLSESPQHEHKNVSKPTVDKKSLPKKNIVKKNEKAYLKPENSWKNKSLSHSPSSKRSHSESSDSESSCNLTVSSLSCTSLSSISDTDNLISSRSETKDKRALPNQNFHKGRHSSSPHYRHAKDPSPIKYRRKLSPKRNASFSPTHKSIFGSRVHKKTTETNTKSQSISTGSKETVLNPTTLSNQSDITNFSKPPLIKKVKKKVSKSELELLKYQGLVSVNNNNKSSFATQVIKPAPKPVKVETIPVLPPQVDKSKVIDGFKVPKGEPKSNVTKNKITLTLQPKSEILSKFGDPQVTSSSLEKKSASKRDLLLQQLKAIEDAIERKKQSG